MGMNDVTLREYAQRRNISDSTVRNRLKLAGIAYNRNAVVTPQLYAILESKPERARRNKPEAKQVIAPEIAKEIPELMPDPKNFNRPAFGRQFLLDVPTLAELLMVLIGAAWLFGALGAIVAIAAISFYAHTAMELRAGDSQFAQDFGLFVCAGLGVVFMWLHGQTFWKVYTGAQDLQYWVSCGCALLLSIISYSALVQTRAVKT